MRFAIGVPRLARGLQGERENGGGAVNASRAWSYVISCASWHRWGLSIMAGTPAPLGQEKQISDTIVAHDLVTPYLERHPKIAETWRVERYYEILTLAEQEAQKKANP